jgi:hypothetical protein
MIRQAEEITTRRTARKFPQGNESERQAKKKHLAKILSVSDRVVADWLSRIDKDAKEARNRRIFNLWLTCYTQEEIAEKENLPRSTVETVLTEIADLQKSSKSDRAAADHATEFDVPIYNVWKQQEKTTGSNHFGTSWP